MYTSNILYQNKCHKYVCHDTRVSMTNGQVHYHVLQCQVQTTYTMQVSSFNFSNSNCSSLFDRAMTSRGGKGVAAACMTIGCTLILIQLTQ